METLKGEIVWKLAETLTPTQWGYLSTLMGEKYPATFAAKIRLLKEIAQLKEE